MDWVISIIFLAGFLYFAVINGIIFYNNFIVKEKYSSWVPFLGGVLGVIGLVKLPLEIADYWNWAPLILDMGSLPAVCLTLFYFAPGKGARRGGEGK